MSNEIRLATNAGSGTLPPVTIRPWDAKLSRAQELLNTLSEEIRTFTESGDVGVEIDGGPGDQARIVRLVQKRDPPIRLSVIIGDFLHNTRSALDSVVFALATFYAGRPLTETEEGALAFPVTFSTKEFESELKRKHLRLLPEDVIDRIRLCQPGYRDERFQTPLTAEDLRWVHLAVLKRLSNVDKHRTLHLTVWFPNDLSVGYDQGLPTWRWSPPPWIDGSEVGRWILNAEDAGVELQHDGKVDLALAEDWKETIDPTPVVVRLGELLAHVRGPVIQPLAAFLSSQED